ncbi:MAG: DUF559 domain-containing protein [Acidimicrobiia bacterium]
MKNIEKIYLIAGLQHGVIARYQIINAGIKPAAVDRILNTSLFTRKDRSIYVLKTYKNCWHQKAAIALFSCGPQALLSNVSALINYGLVEEDFSIYRSRLFSNQNDPLRFDVLSPRDYRYKKNINFHRSTKPENYENSQILNGLPTVSIERAIAECAQAVGPSRLSKIIHLAISKKLTNAQKIFDVISSLHSAPGREKKILKQTLLPYIVNEDVAKIESVLEKRVYDVLNLNTQFDIVPQYEIICGTNRYRLDFAILSHKIAIEVDGFAYHSSISELERDHQRQNDIVSMGWRVVRVNAKFTDSQILDAVLNAA